MSSRNTIDAPERQEARVRDVMITHPKLVDSTISVRRAKELFADEHVHLLLLVDDRRLVGTLARADIPNEPLRRHGSAVMFAVMEGRWIREDELANDVLSQMSSKNIRRLAVIDEAQKLVGLLCLKRSGNGFCSNENVEARASALASESTPRNADAVRKP